ncbi:MAG: DNA polymerase [Patescibacteria group bacterium]
MSSQSVNKNRFVLLDAHAIIHRAYHALPDFATSKGEPTGALYGLTSMILKIVTELKPDYIVAAYDLPKPTYRHEVYKEYKAGRAKTDDDLAIQLEKSKELVEALNIPIYAKEGFEADDILGTIVEQLKIENRKSKIPNVDVVIASGDMDTLQLVDDAKGKASVKVYTLKKGITDTILYDEEAVKERFGFEPKFLPDYKGLRGDPSDNIVGIAGIGEKTATELITQFGTIENIYRKITNHKSQITNIKPRILELLKTGEEEAKFSKMLATIRRDAPIKFEMPEKNWREGIDLEKAKQLFNKLEFRTMGTRLEATLNGSTVAVVQKNKEKKEETKTDPTELEETKVALWVVDSNYTNPTPDDLYDFANTTDFKKAKEIIFDELKKREAESVFEKIEKPLIPIVEKMHERGILVDAGVFKKLNKEYSGELGEIEKKVWKLAGQEFNIASPKQMGEVLFEKMSLVLKNHKKTAGGAKSTRESELEKMKELHPIIPLILEYRELSKLLGTYIEPIPKMLDKNSRLHSRFIQTGAATGRMASHDPNLQNIPISTERGRAIRQAFLATSGFKLAAFDYSQIELRIAAILSGDKTLIEIFKSGEDVHTSAASLVFGIPKENVTKEMRRKAKVINFGILYGMGVNALAANLGSGRKEAQEFYNAYFHKFAGLAIYLDNVKRETNERGYTQTIFGRRRYFEGIKSPIPYIRASAERMAINAPLQGSQADIIKLAMIRIDEWVKSEKLGDKIHLLLQIHDELIFEIEASLMQKASQEIKKIMESVLTSEQTNGVPIIVNSDFGENWANLK